MCPTGTTLSHQCPSLRSAFHVIDKDHDGLISKNDLKQFYGETAQDDIIGLMMHAADFNKDGFVEFEEFKRVVEEVKTREFERQKKETNGVACGVMEDVFKVMDQDGDGIVGVEDLKGFFKVSGIEVNDEDIKAMVKLGCGGDEAQGVGFDGFLKILAF